MPSGTRPSSSPYCAFLGGLPQSSGYDLLETKYIHSNSSPNVQTPGIPKRKGVFSAVKRPLPETLRQHLYCFTGRCFQLPLVRKTGPVMVGLSPNAPTTLSVGMKQTASGACAERETHEQNRGSSRKKLEGIHEWILGRKVSRACSPYIASK